MRPFTMLVVSAVTCVGLSSCGTDDGTAGPATSAGSTEAAVNTAAPEIDVPETTMPSSSTEAAVESTSPTTAPAEATEPTTAPDIDAGQVMIDFTDAGSIEGWSNVDDSVMGGVSASTTSWTDEQMVFSGDLSLENNGGFTSVRSPQDLALGTALDGAAGIGVVAEGDGKTYILQLRTAADRLYIARFVTVDGDEQRYELPLSEFQPVTRFLEPDPGSPPLEPDSVDQIAIYLLDGQVGPFRLAVRSIEAVAPTPI